LRKAMGKKKADVMQAQRTKFVTGAISRGINEKKATQVFDLMEHFAGYGFPKAHSTAYALLAYQTAYLKANYPWHFAAALLTIEAQNTDKLALYLGECRERGIPVLPPDINQSQVRFVVDPEQGVRFGLLAIKNVGEGALESLAQGEPTLAGLSSRELRPRLMAAIDAACEHGARHQRDKSEGQAQLFGAFADGGGNGLDDGKASRLPDQAAWVESEQLAF